MKYLLILLTLNTLTLSAFDSLINVGNLGGETIELEVEQTAAPVIKNSKPLEIKKPIVQRADQPKRTPRRYKRSRPVTAPAVATTAVVKKSSEPVVKSVSTKPMNMPKNTPKVAKEDSIAAPLLSSGEPVVKKKIKEHKILKTVKTVRTPIKLDPFTSPFELKDMMSNQNLIIVDVDDKNIYSAGHIRDAVHFDVTSLVKNGSNPYDLMKKDSAIQTEIQELGVYKDSAVVIYAHNTLKGNQNAAYLAFVLITYGFENVSILDGGYMTWVFENKRLVSAENNSPEYDGDFTVLKNENIIVNKDYILSNLYKIRVLDAREREYYFGTSKAKKIPAFGHISSAKSSYTGDKFLIDGMIREKQELENIYYQGLGLRENDDVVIYADTVFQASMEWYLLYKVMNFKHVKIYEAGLLEYFEDDANPVTRFKFE